MIFKQIFFREDIQYPIIEARNTIIKSDFYEVLNLLNDHSAVYFCIVLRPESSNPNTIHIPLHLKQFFNPQNHPDVFIKVTLVEFKEGIL